MKHAFLGMMLVMAALGCLTGSRAVAADSSKMRVARERRFLLRIADDLNQSGAYVQETARMLDGWNAAVTGVGTEGSAAAGELLEWYRSYLEWLHRNRAGVEDDLSASYSHPEGWALRPDRNADLAGGYSRLEGQLGDLIARLDLSNETTLKHIARLRTVLAYLSSAEFREERDRDHKQDRKSGRDGAKERQRKDADRDKRHHELHERYKDVTDAQIATMQLELHNLGELQKEFALLLETARMERSWVVRRIGDYEALGGLAALVAGSDPASLEKASLGMIKLYESDASYFKEETADVSLKKDRIAPSGSLNDLDRMQSLSDGYDLFKRRLEHHIGWLSEQIGAYRADIIEARSGR